MQTAIVPEIASTERGREADAILRKCVHCGFCNATCPTYQLLGDELDGPRGRIYLIKQMLEGEPPNDQVKLHLDRCLTCRNCESTCPSGVDYSKLLEIGRDMLDRNKRGFVDRTARKAVTAVISRPAVFGTLYGIGNTVSPLLPPVLKEKIPPKAESRDIDWPEDRHERKAVALAGCALGALAPSTNVVAAHVLDRLGISLIEARGAGCCGSVHLHTTTEAAARESAKRLIDTWVPWLERGVEAFVMTVTGCGVTVKEYPHLFRSDPEYREKATRIAEMTFDLCEILDREIGEDYSVEESGKSVAFHPPCTLQHGQKITGVVEGILRRVGYEVRTIRDGHLCCGSAGTYSLLQPVISGRLRENKVQSLRETDADIICTANVGCQTHLGDIDGKPVRYWAELLLGPHDTL